MNLKKSMKRNYTGLCTLLPTRSLSPDALHTPGIFCCIDILVTSNECRLLAGCMLASFTGMLRTLSMRAPKKKSKSAVKCGSR